MIKLTLNDRSGMRDGAVWISPDHVVSLVSANPSGTIVTLTRGQMHVAQSVDQVLKQLPE